MKKIIIDCDPGIDDALALLFAFGLEETEVLALTCVAGNRPVEQTFKNARDLCHLAGRTEIRVFRGSETPLQFTKPKCNLVHGEDGLGGVLLPNSAADVQLGHAVTAILGILRNEPANTVTLVAIGPLTNIALAVKLDPIVMRRANSVAIMGGAANVSGNVTPVAEFNFWADPLAADIVLQSGVPVHLFPLDVTSKAICTKDWIEAVAGLNTKPTKLLSKMLASYFGEDPLLHDPCPIAWLAKPELFLNRLVHMRVETIGEHTLGKSVSWLPTRGDCPSAPNVNLYHDVDCEALLETMYKALSRLNE